MALYNQAFWNSGALWSDTSPPLTLTPDRKRKNMKRQPYFPRTLAQRPEWFANYAIQLPIVNTTLSLPAPSVTASVADARYCEYASGVWLTATREFGPTATAALEQLYDGAGAAPYAMPAFTAPALPAGVTAVPPGALRRIFAFVQTIKAAPAYTEALGLQLGVVGQEDSSEHPLPEFTLKVERGEGCECVRLNFRKFGRQGVVIYSRRGGGAWEQLGIDLTTPYLDERPLLNPAQPEVREYRLQYFDGDQATGDFTEVQSATLAP